MTKKKEWFTPRELVARERADKWASRRGMKVENYPVAVGFMTEEPLNVLNVVVWSVFLGMILAVLVLFG